MTRATGPGALTDDGCAVDLYRRLPPLGEAEIVHEVVGAQASILDLGCGTGRIAHRLLELGHEVVGVDQSADMLAHVRGARTVQAPIAGLDLDRRFDAVLLASHLLNTPDDTERRALLDTAARHLAPGGLLVAEWHPPEWFEKASATGPGRLGDVLVELRDTQLAGDLLTGTVRYWAGNDLWTQTFTARRIDDEALRRELGDAGLSFERWCDENRNWFVATRSG